LISIYQRKRFRIRIREKNEKKEKKEQAFSENLGELSEEQKLLLVEALDLGLVTQEQIDANQFEKRLNKYALIFSKDGLIDKHFKDKSSQIQKRLKGA
jgi:hypothetical protein